MNLLQAMQESGVDQIVFSSSAATFGTPDVDLVTEETPTIPESPYGESKLIGEWVLRDQARATGLRHTSLRYFNVVGSGYDDLYDTSPAQPVPDRLRDAAGREDAADQRRPTTPPPTAPACATTSTCSDLAAAHVVAAQRLAAGDALEPVYNLGSGDGVSVRRDHGHHPHGDRHRLHARARRRVAPATRPGSSPPATWPRATSTGRCGTRSRTWSARPGRRGAAPTLTMISG